MNDREEVNRIWLWKGGPHRFVGYDNEFPNDADGDPLVVGEPCAVFDARAQAPMREVVEALRKIARGISGREAQEIARAAIAAWEAGRPTCPHGSTGPCSVCGDEG